MTSPLADFKRDGMSKLIGLAKVMCFTVTRFKPVILAKFGSNIAIVGLIEAIEAVCSLLPDAENAFLAIHLDETPPPNDPADIAGTDPDAWSALPPDYEP